MFFFKFMYKCFDSRILHYVCAVLNVLDNEIDGETMVGLTEQMIANLLPTIRSQVQFMKVRAEVVAKMPSAKEPEAVAHNVPTERSGVLIVQV